MFVSGSQDESIEFTHNTRNRKVQRCRPPSVDQILGTGHIVRRLVSRVERRKKLWRSATADSDSDFKGIFLCQSIR